MRNAGHLKLIVVADKRVKHQNHILGSPIGEHKIIIDCGFGRKAQRSKGFDDVRL